MQQPTTQRDLSTNDHVVVRVIGTSDLHGRFLPWDYALDEESRSGSVAQLATLVRRSRTDSTLLLDAGDTIQDNSAEIFLGDEVHPMAAAINEMGYDVWVTGNHDYNYGLGVLRKTISSLGCKTLVGNVRDRSGDPLADGYAIFTPSGVRVAVIGMVTPNIKRWDAANLAGCDVTSPVDECRRIIDSLAGQYDVLVGVMHMGVENEYGVVGSGVEDLTRSCPEFDLVIAAHTHKRVGGEVHNGVLVVENLPHAQTAAVVDIEMARDGAAWRVSSLSSEVVDVAPYEPDARMSELLAPFHARARQDASVVIGRLEGDSLAPGSEVAEIPVAHIADTPLIDLINRVQMHYTGAQVSATALFRPDANLSAGPIRKRDVSLIYKFANTLYNASMTGRQLKAFMEWSAAYLNTYHEGDLTLSFNPTMPDYNHYMFSGVYHDIDVSQEPGNRIRNLAWPDGRLVEDDDELTIAVSDYCANVLFGNPGILYGESDLPKILEIDVRGDLGGVRELIRDYIANESGGTLTARSEGWWKVVGNEWDAGLHQRAARLIADGRIVVPRSEDGSVKNVRAVTVADVIAAEHVSPAEGIRRQLG